MKLCIAAATVLLIVTTVVPRLHAQDAASELVAPDAVTSQLATDEKDKPDLLGIDAQAGFDEWKVGVKERTGLDFGIDYNSLGFAAIDSPGKSTAAGGVFRVFGSWELYNRGETNTGSIVFKVENRHTYSDVAPSAFGGELGYAGLTSSVQIFERTV